MIKRHTRPNPAQADQGRHRRAGEPDHGSNVMIVCPGCHKAVRMAHHVDTVAGGKTRRTRVCRKCGADARQEVSEDFMAARLREHYQKNGGSGAHQGVRLQERHGGAEDREDHDQHRPGRSHPERQADGRRGERTGQIAGQKPVITKATQVDRRSSSCARAVDRLHGDAARRPHVRILRPAGERGSAARPRFPRRVARKIFDGRGNYTLGIKDQLIFPEIDYSKVDKTKGMNISHHHHGPHRCRGPGAAEADGNAVPAA